LSIFCPPPPSPHTSTLSLHDALPISIRHRRPGARHAKTSRELRTGIRPQFSRALRRFRCDRQGRKRLQGVLSEIAGKDSGRIYRDRKSTRLNSSHEWISYAVFCLKKK